MRRHPVGPYLPFHDCRCTRRGGEARDQREVTRSRRGLWQSNALNLVTERLLSSKVTYVQRFQRRCVRTESGQTGRVVLVSHDGLSSRPDLRRRQREGEGQSYLV